MQINEPSQTLAIITDASYYPIYFKQKFGDLYYISPLSVTDFELKDLKFLYAHIIIIDDQAFGEDIFTLISHIRRMPHYHDKPILIITTKLKRAYIDRLIKAGANDILREPLVDEVVAKCLHDVEKRKKISEKLYTIATNMTSLSSSQTEEPIKQHFFFDKESMRPFQEAICNNAPLVTLVIEVDQLKLLNNEHHEALTALLKASFTPKDLFLVLGQGRYIAFLSAISSRKGFMIAQSLKDDVSSASLTSAKGDVQVTLSIGLAAQKKPPYASLREMVVAARDACLIAKKEGNSVQSAHD